MSRVQGHAQQQHSTVILSFLRHFVKQIVFSEQRAPRVPHRDFVAKREREVCF